MLGAIAGDIIGSRFEFNPIKTKEFELFGEGSQFTDDTVMTVATMGAILQNQEHPDFRSAYQYWGRKYANRGYGGMFVRWLQMKTPVPYNSFGNGSAMRVSPVGWAYDSLEKVRAYAKRSAEVSHNHPEGIKGAEVIASAIFLARTQNDKNVIREYVERHFSYNLSRSVAEIRQNYDFDVTCQGSVPEAIICFLESNSYEDCIRNAVSLGGDADTQAAIAGGIAEAFYGGVAPEIEEQVYSRLPEDMHDVILEFEQIFSLHNVLPTSF